MQKRALTINFERSITAGVPSEREVVVAPLSEPNAPDLDATLVGGPETRIVVLGNVKNPVVFYLVPTDHPDLTTRVTYRIAWRDRYMGRQYTKDFVMPDFDCDFDDLNNLGNIIGGETYVQWSDRSVPNGVAGLNSQGQVIDANGQVVSGAESAATVQGHLDAEIVTRQQQDQALRSYFLQFTNDQITQVYTTAATNLQNAVSQLQNTDIIEKAQRQAAIVSLNTSLSNIQTATNQQIANLNALVDQYNQNIAKKADLVGGKIPSSQIPDIALGKSVTVANQAAMLALTSSQVQQGDFAVRPDGVWFLNAAPPSVLGNWVQFTVAASVFSINGQTGAVNLSAADIGARSASVPVPLADVAGLSSALDAKTSSTVTSALATRVGAIETDSAVVRKVNGLILRADMPVDAVFVNTSNLITKKDGTVLNVGGGGTLDIADVDGLPAALASLLPKTDPSVSNPRIPVAHKASHSINGTDPLSPSDIGAANAVHTHPQSDVVGLTSNLSSHGIRIDSLETRVEDIETSGTGSGGGGTGAGASGKTVWFSAASPTTTFTDILLRSPFGQSLSDGHYYYNPAGVSSDEAVWPYLTPNGHLKFVKRNESAPADLPYATQQGLDALSATVTSKAPQSALDLTNAAVDTKASLSALSTLQANVDTKAAKTDLSNLSNTVASKADKSALDGVSSTVATKADKSALDSLTTTVSGKASAADLTTVTTRVANVESGKADLSSGVVPLTQVPVLPLDKVSGLGAALDAKAPLVNSSVPLSNLPSYPTSKVSGLDTLLTNKADLDSTGKIPSSQIPSLAITSVTTVANRGAMLALPSSQVQQGDVAVITDTADKGSYILSASDPSVFSSWTRLLAPDDSVQTVNNQRGNVVLSAADVGARSSAVQIPQSDVTGLTNSLSAKADTTALTSGLATKTSSADVQSIISDSVAFKQRADYVATSSVPTLSGQQTVDGVITPLGSVVLLTAQPSSVNNGLWQVNSSAWTRVSDMPSGSYFLRGTAVSVLSGSAANASSLWQQTNVSGIVATNANNWSKVLVAGSQATLTASLGVTRVVNDFRAVAAPGGGLQVVAAGIQRDPLFVPGKYAVDVPGGSPLVTITHNLNTYDVSMSLRDKASGDAALIGWSVTGLQTISLDFDTNIPSAGQWRCVVFG